MAEADSLQGGRRSGEHSALWWQTVKRRWFGTWREALLTLICAVLIVCIVVWLARWAFIDAVWTATDVGRCGETDGACWSVIHARYRLILFGLYPHEEQWRSALSCLIVIAMVVASCVRACWRPLPLLAIWSLGATAFFALMQGGVAGLPMVPTDKWGGLVLTLFVYVC